MSHKNIDSIIQINNHSFFNPRVFKSLNNNIITKLCDHVSFRSNYKSHQSKSMNKGSFYLHFYAEIIKPIYKYNFSVFSLFSKMIF